jgi:3'-phosphoadenosine 5'-phosphosulfate sulfotransferase (PAPS reductase)/FAD synthetase
LGGFEVWYGMRSGESDARAKRYAGKVCDEVYPPHEVMPSKYPQYLAKLGVSFRLAVLNWSKLDVLEYLDGQENPLYETFDRVGCFPCQAAGDPHKEKAYAYDDFGREQKRKVFAIAQQINKPMFNSKGGQARNPGCGVCSI